MRITLRDVLSRLTISLVAAIAATMAFKADPTQAAAFVKFPGIDGEVLDERHKGWCDLNSLGQALIQPKAGASGQRRDDVVLEDLTLTKSMDSCSPKLAEAVCDGKSFPEVIVELCAPGVGDDGGLGEQCYLRYELKNVHVVSYSVGDGGAERPSETIALNFEELKVIYTPADPALPPSETTLGGACSG